MSNTHEARIARLVRLRTLSNLLDNAIAIPGTNYRVGIDPLLGLIPGGGDTLTAFLSAYIVLEAALLGLPRETLGRMFVNLIIDTVVGSFPVLGDFFDVTWKANAKNVDLVEAHLKLPESSQKADKFFIILILVGLLLFVGTVAFLSFTVIRLFLSLFTVR